MSHDNDPVPPGWRNPGLPADLKCAPALGHHVEPHTCCEPTVSSGVPTDLRCDRLALRRPL